jgi:uncharacterized protein (DUF1810 family)
MTEEYDLHRFLKAQENVYETVLRELRSGQKRTHWMWFIFPQLEGLGSSPTARFYSIKSRGEAEAYLDHSTLGNRLRECVAILLSIEGRTASQVFGYPDDAKLKSSMTLFDVVSRGENPFAAVLEKYFEGERDKATIELLNR